MRRPFFIHAGGDHGEASSLSLRGATACAARMSGIIVRWSCATASSK